MLFWWIAVVFISDHVAQMRAQIIITSVPAILPKSMDAWPKLVQSLVYGYFTKDQRKMISSFKVVKLGNVSPGNVIGYIYTLVVIDSLENNADTQRIKVEF